MSWADAVQATALFAIDPVALGGVRVRASAGPVRDHWLAMLRGLLPADAPVRRLPLGIADSRLLGGLDLAATLSAGRPVAERGVLAEADGGVVLVAMAERLSVGTAARIGAVLESGVATVARDGIAGTHAARIGLVALDEGAGDDETPPAGLLDRLAFAVALDGLTLREIVGDDGIEPEAAAAARLRLPLVSMDEAIVDAIADTATALGVASARAPLLAVRAARAAAALDGRLEVAREDAALACRLVLAQRATRAPSAEPEETEPPPPDQSEREAEQPAEDAGARELGEILLAAARAAIPPGLLAQLQDGARARAAARTAGRVGQMRASGTRGRPAGVRPGDPRDGARLNVIETLRAAAPWQAIRRGGAAPGQPAIRREDFRVARLRQKAGTTTIFVVDASGSAAANRLAEAKGAVELLLADCYKRRDQVAVIAFRGRAAQVLLPPTRSLVRAKRSLAGLPGGGGTPLAAGIDAARELAEATRRRSETPAVVLLTDGRANVARDGSGGRAQAMQDVTAAARLFHAAGLAGVLIDTSVRPQSEAARVAVELGVRYLPLPYASARVLSDAVRGVTGQPGL